MITNEIKAKVFSGYLPYFIDSHMRLGMLKIIETLLVENPKYHNRLILKPLDNLTDEDEIGLANIIGSLRTDEFINALITGGFYALRIYETLQAVQFLQSKGYDLPQHLLEGKTLHEAGLATYE